MGTKKGMIFGSRLCGSWDFLRPYLHWPEVVLAADGGQLAAKAAGFTPTVYIGDGDSGGAPLPGQTQVLLPPEKDVTDLEAAYDWAKAHGVEELIFTGCTGGRLDHHMSAMGLLERAAREGVQAVILDEGNRVRFLLPGTYSVPRGAYRYFSLISVDPVLEGLTITGAKYPLSCRDVCRGHSLTISNEVSCRQAEISFTGGCGYLIEAS